MARLLDSINKTIIIKEKSKYIPGIWVNISNKPFPLPPSFTAPSYYIINTQKLYP